MTYFKIFVKTPCSTPIEVDLPIDVSFLSGISMIKQTVSNTLGVSKDDVRIIFMGEAIDEMMEQSVSAAQAELSQSRKRPREDFNCMGCGSSYNGNSQYCSRQCMMMNG